MFLFQNIDTSTRARGENGTDDNLLPYHRLLWRGVEAWTREKSQPMNTQEEFSSSYKALDGKEEWRQGRRHLCDSRGWDHVQHCHTWKGNT